MKGLLVCKSPLAIGRTLGKFVTELRPRREALAFFFGFALNQVYSELSVPDGLVGKVRDASNMIAFSNTDINETLE